MTLFAFESVSKRYLDGRRTVSILEDVSFEIDAGDFVGVWGGRRSGKTTFLRVAAGLERPDEGRILFEDKDLVRLLGKARALLLRSRGVGYISADWRPASRQEVVEYVAMPLTADGLSLRKARYIARQYLQDMDVLHCAAMHTGRLSVGEAARVCLAGVLAREPRLLLIDEPALLPSPIERLEFYEVLRSQARVAGRAMVVASEDLRVIEGTNRQMSIGAGTLRVMDDTHAEVLSFPRRKTSGSHSG